MRHWSRVSSRPPRAAPPLRCRVMAAATPEWWPSPRVQRLFATGFIKWSRCDEQCGRSSPPVAMFHVKHRFVLARRRSHPRQHRIDGPHMSTSADVPPFLPARRILPVAATYGAVAGAVAGLALTLMNGVQHLIWHGAQSPVRSAATILLGGVIIVPLRHKDPPPRHPRACSVAQSAHHGRRDGRPRPGHESRRLTWTHSAADRAPHLGFSPQTCRARFPGPCPRPGGRTPRPRRRGDEIVSHSRTCRHPIERSSS